MKTQEVPLHHVSVQGLLPSTSHFVTYEGSLTVPACHESVTWLVINRPIYITKQQLYILRKLMQGDERNPKAPLGNNFRPPLPLNRRALRSNINFIRQDVSHLINKSICIVTSVYVRYDVPLPLFYPVPLF
ncbi:carbonic anhydrase-related protein 10 [Trichonephila inaurata madagascariensis]|uniref:Carbonic anhydrase-related protein 10 n=1 Tax=Trichonephila inaurata madagascariensis TaxID=2747483 RepID=A0A8X6YDW3_9ARAC|nr:carbonic anhydrase-related protein 10 [Trichonephila inaurata madagascariensis]